MKFLVAVNYESVEDRGEDNRRRQGIPEREFAS